MYCMVFVLRRGRERETERERDRERERERERDREREREHTHRVVLKVLKKYMYVVFFLNYQGPGPEKNNNKIKNNSENDYLKRFKFLSKNPFHTWKNA